MKLSNKLVKKLTSFSETYDGLKKATKDVAEQIEEMKELTEEGAELKIANFSRKTSVTIKNFAKAVEGLKDSVDEVEVAIEDASKLATEEASKNAELASFARKIRVTKKVFSTIDAKFSEAGEAIASALEAKNTETNVKESVVPASAEINPKPDETATTTKVSGNPPSKGVVEADEGKINKAESINFSKTEFVKFSLANALKAFADFAEELDGAADLVSEVVEVAKPEPVATEETAFDAEGAKKELIDAGIEAYKAGDEAKREEIANKAAELEAEVPGAGEEVVTAIENFAAQNPKAKTEEACPICGMTPCECSKPAETKNFSTEEVKEEVKTEEVDPQAELIKEQEALVEAGIKAFAAKDESAADEVAKKAQELEDKSEGAGVQVVETIENFATLFKLGFGTKSISFSDENKEKTFSAIKEALNFAAEKMVSGDKWDSDALAAKCEDLEAQAPGAGEIVVSTIENFNKIASSVKEKMTPDTKEKVIKEFSEALEKFVEEIPVADKTFAHKLKKSCFAALESCDAGDDKACADFCDSVSKGLAEPTVTDQKLKDFGKSLEAFCGRFAKFAENATQEAPENVAKCDCELNEVLSKMGEKGAQLDAKTSTFATKLCDSYKSMKCFTEEQLENKIKLVEDLKQSFSTIGVNFGEEEVKNEAEVKVETPEEKTEPVVAVPGDGSAAQEPEAKTETPEVQVGPDQLDPRLVNVEGDAGYDPTAISELKLIEEEEVPAESQPSDADVTIPVNFSETKEDTNSYGDKVNSLFDL